MPKEKKIKASQEPVAYSLADICLPESSKHSKSESLKKSDKSFRRSKSRDNEDESSKTNGTPMDLSEIKSSRKKSDSRFSDENVVENSVILAESKIQVDNQNEKEKVIQKEKVFQKEKEEIIDVSNTSVVDMDNPVEDAKSGDDQVERTKLPKDIELLQKSQESVNNQSLKKITSHYSPPRTKNKNRTDDAKQLRDDKRPSKRNISAKDVKIHKKVESENEPPSKLKKTESKDSRQRIKERISKVSTRRQSSSSSSSRSRSSSSSGDDSSSSSSSSNLDSKSYKGKMRSISPSKSKDCTENRTKSKKRSLSRDRNKNIKVENKPNVQVTSEQKTKRKFESRRSLSRSRSRDRSESEKEHNRKISSDNSHKEIKSKKSLPQNISSDYEKKKSENKVHSHSPTHSNSDVSELRKSFSRSLSKERIIEKRKVSRTPSPVCLKEKIDKKFYASHTSREYSDSASDSDLEEKHRKQSTEDSQIPTEMPQPDCEEKEQEEVIPVPQKCARVESGDEDVISAVIERSDEILQERDEGQIDDNLDQDIDMKEEGELGSEDNTEVETPPANISYRKLNIPFKRTESKEKSQRRKRWSVKNTVQKSTVNISSESLKNLIPSFTLICPKTKESEEMPPKPLEPVTKPSVDLEKKSPKKPITKSAESSTIDAVVEKGAFSCALLLNALSTFCKKKVPARKHDILKKKEDIKREKPENLPENMEEESIPVMKSSVKPPSCIVFIQNLVRPFTLQQLKDMLAQTGTITEDGFWIDKIKSKCFVKYEKQHDAMKTRELLDGSKWPLSNPKILVAEFATQEEFDLHTKAYEFPKPPPGLLTSQQDPRKREDLRESSDIARRRRDKTELRPRDRDRDRERERGKNISTHVREWDKDKISQDSPERENIRPHRDVDRSSERKKEKKESKKKPIEETPAKLLDDLFQKTKTTPCIYWLPLTEEQAKKKEEERRQRRLDRERRMQQEEAERRAKHKAREKGSRSRSRSRTGRRR